MELDSTKTTAPTFEYSWKTTRRWENERDARTWLNLQTENTLWQWTLSMVNNERGRAGKQHNNVHPRQFERGAPGGTQTKDTAYYRQSNLPFKGNVQYGLNLAK